MNDNRGFTLIEVLASITILAIIGIGLFQFFIMSQKGTINSQEKLEAFNIAQTVFERVKSGEYSDEIKGDEITEEYERNFTNDSCTVGDCDYKYIFEANNREYKIRIIVKEHELDLHKVEVFVSDGEEDRSRVKGLIKLKEDNS